MRLIKIKNRLIESLNEMYQGDKNAVAHVPCDTLIYLPRVLLGSSSMRYQVHPQEPYRHRVQTHRSCNNFQKALHIR